MEWQLTNMELYLLIINYAMLSTINLIQLTPFCCQFYNVCLSHVPHVMFLNDRMHKQEAADSMKTVALGGRHEEVVKLRLLSHEAALKGAFQKTKLFTVSIA